MIVRVTATACACRTPRQFRMQNEARRSLFPIPPNTLLKKKSGSDCSTHYDEYPCFSFTYDIVLQYDEQGRSITVVIDKKLFVFK
ncbi:hypothetical protein GHT06_008879 [Daphnia sinensis]|uniref:Uncharacterized protein n=1 Tax=Daphnia sinensis TaxID=1820382 RepID=A0AAD5PYU5_9CRUS|nr:hypothetical protein GHT06_008879 [Daphnia sinensis]